MIAPNVTGQVIEMHKTSKLRFSRSRRPPVLQLPPIFRPLIEAGLPDMISQNFVALFAPAGTPKAHY